MNWAPPTIDDHPSTPPESDAERRGISAIPAAAWLALLGSALLLTAAIAVVASNWSAIGQSFRVAGLVAVTAGLLLAAERWRLVVPTTASITAHAGTYLTASVGIAALSLAGLTWPACLVAGGALLIVATEYQAARWRRITMHVAQIAGWAMASTGAAALLGTTAGLVAMLASVGLLTFGAQRRSVTLALLAVLSPALTALAEAGVGDGSLTRAGLVGERLGWSGPVVGLLAATLIGAIALQRRNNPLILVAAASPIVGVVTGLAASDGSAIAWWSVPALVLFTTEVALWLLPSDRFRTQITDVANIGAATIAAVAWLSPALATLDVVQTELAHPWAIPITLTTLALMLSCLRWVANDSRLADLGFASVAAGVIGVFVAFEAPDLLTAGVAVAATLGVAVVSRRIAALAIHPTALWALLAIAVAGDNGRSTGDIVVGAVLLALVGIVVATRARLAAADGPLGWVEMTGIAAGAALGALAITADHGPAVGLGTVAIVAVFAALLDRRHTPWCLAAVAGAGVIAFDATMASGGLDGTYWAGWAVATAALTLAWGAHRSMLMSYGAVVAATITVATAAVPLGISQHDFVVMAMLATVALTGLAYAIDRRTPLDAAALATGVILVASTTVDIDTAWTSAAVLLFGLQIVVGGLAVDRRTVQWAGVVVATAGLVSWWFTSGLHDRFVDLLEPADIRVSDVWLAGASIAALITGVTLRASHSANSWVSYSAALAIPGVWLTSVHVDRGTVWAIPLLLTIGIVASAFGAWHRLAALLVGGTVLSGLGVVLAIDADLTTVPTWTWLATGGLALLVTAVVIERAATVGSAGLRELVDRWN